MASHDDLCGLFCGKPDSGCCNKKIPKEPERVKEVTLVKNEIGETRRLGHGSVG